MARARAPLVLPLRAPRGRVTDFRPEQSHAVAHFAAVGDQTRVDHANMTDQLVKWAAVTLSNASFQGITGAVTYSPRLLL